MGYRLRVKFCQFWKKVNVLTVIKMNKIINQDKK